MTFTAGSIGGKYQEILTDPQMPRHRHLGAVSHSDGEFATEYIQASYVAGSGRLRQITSYSGNNEPHNNIPPYAVAFKWQRTL
nr:MAG: protein of unknown function (DUF859) [Bacteriophage sp.]